MNISFYTSRTGMIAQQQGLNIYANNIANVNTVGYKSLRPSFAECLYTHQHHNREQWQTGHGQYMSKTDLMWEQGGLVFTEQHLDFALPNDGFFMTLDRDGNRYLTRDGRFAITNTGGVGGAWELVNGFGDFVLDFEGNRIQIPFLMRDGEVTTNIDYDALYAMIGVYAVPNNWGLDQAENNRFIITGRSGEAVAVPEYDKIPGALELSATDLAGDMVRIIETQRSYQLNARIVRVSDEMMTTVNSLR
jgi:flagellar basal-body rod protein FlgG